LNYKGITHEKCEKGYVRLHKKKKNQETSEMTRNNEENEEKEEENGIFEGKIKILNKENLKKLLLD